MYYVVQPEQTKYNPMHISIPKNNKQNQMTTRRVTRSMSTEAAVATLASVFDDNHLVQHILTFVGENQYRFVAAVNRDFHAAYLHVFPGNTLTRIDVSTIRHASICYAEVPRGDRNASTMMQRSMCRSAARHGNLAVLQYLRSMNCQWDANTCAYAATSGHLQILKWARANGCPWNTDTCRNAARNGHFEVLQWARANGCPWEDRTCALAAKSGHLHILQWAHANGCPWDSFTCACAAEGGHIHILQWARANGCPWNEQTCHGAASNGHLLVLKWARENKCPWWGYHIVRMVTERGRYPEMLEWIVQNMDEEDND
jgi:hypothetical protein